MLDKRTDSLLRFICSQCSEGSYKLFVPSELIAAVPKKFAIDLDALVLMLNYLREREYILLKYSDEESVCLTPLPKGRIYCEDTVKKRLSVPPFVCTGAGAFLGSAAAVLLLRLLGVIGG